MVIRVGESTGDAARSVTSLGALALTLQPAINFRLVSVSMELTKINVIPAGDTKIAAYGTLTVAVFCLQHRFTCFINTCGNSEVLARSSTSGDLIQEWGTT